MFSSCVLCTQCAAVDDDMQIWGIFIFIKLKEKLTVLSLRADISNTGFWAFFIYVYVRLNKNIPIRITRTQLNTRWTRTPAKGKQLSPCFSYTSIQSNPVKVVAVIEERKHLPNRNQYKHSSLFLNIVFCTSKYKAAKWFRWI
jgi:hypothetical protein